MKNQLEILFGSRERWRLIKFFLLNGKGEFFAKEIIDKNKLVLKEATLVLAQLTKSQFLLSSSKQGKKIYSLNKEFPFLEELKNLVVRSNVFPQCESLEKIKGLGDVKLAIISGSFINYPKAKTDLLIVGDTLSQARIKHLLEDLEAEMGRELNYSIMTLAEFKYRANMFDRFILEMLESPHEVVVNKMTQLLSELRRNR